MAFANLARPQGLRRLLAPRLPQNQNRSWSSSSDAHPLLSMLGTH